MLLAVATVKAPCNFPFFNGCFFLSRMISLGLISATQAAIPSYLKAVLDRFHRKGRAASIPFGWSLVSLPPPPCSGRQVAFSKHKMTNAGREEDHGIKQRFASQIRRVGETLH